MPAQVKALIVVLALVAWFGIWAKYGTKVAMTLLLVVVGIVGYIAYLGGFNH